MAGPIHFPVTVESIVRHSPDVATFWLKYVGRRPRFRPGQFIHLAIDPYDPSAHWPESRIFSIASSPSNTEGMRLTIGRHGRFTARLLDETDLGRTFWCKGPYGEFEVRAGNPDETLVLIAGGTGITPFCSHMEEALVRPMDVRSRTILYYGARTASLLIYRDLAERWRQTVPGAQAFFFAEDGASGQIQEGRPDIDSINAEQARAVPCRYFLSGPGPMIDNLRGRLIQVHSVPRGLVMVDSWQ